jgi:ParB family chromosome partitioning protein
MEFDDEKLAELGASLKTQGFIQPLAVRSCRSSDAPCPFQLIEGERCWLAARAIGLAEVPCLVRPATDAEMAELALVANDQREGLNPIERARSYQGSRKRMGQGQ